MEKDRGRGPASVRAGVKRAAGKSDTDDTDRCSSAEAVRARTGERRRDESMLEAELQSEHSIANQ
jgi:hypothetical protein